MQLRPSLIGEAHRAAQEENKTNWDFLLIAVFEPQKRELNNSKGARARLAVRDTIAGGGLALRDGSLIGSRPGAARVFGYF